MFTGLIQMTGMIRNVSRKAQSRRFVVDSKLSISNRALGASIAVSGVCLTVTEAAEQWFAADVGFETLACTTLDRYRVGDIVNLEPALRVGEALGGHWVSGHVDGIATVLRTQARGEMVQIWFQIPDNLMIFVAEKGSVCLDGVSLTINSVQANGFSVGIIPHTLEMTTLAHVKSGDWLNIEVDMLARYVAKMIGRQPKALNEQVLAQEGFISTGQNGKE